MKSSKFNFFLAILLTISMFHPSLKNSDVSSNLILIATAFFFSRAYYLDLLNKIKRLAELNDQSFKTLHLRVDFSSTKNELKNIEIEYLKQKFSEAQIITKTLAENISTLNKDQDKLLKVMMMTWVECLSSQSKKTQEDFKNEVWKNINKAS